MGFSCLGDFDFCLTALRPYYFCFSFFVFVFAGLGDLLFLALLLFLAFKGEYVFVVFFLLFNIGAS